MHHLYSELSMHLAATSYFALKMSEAKESFH